jgi:hypothetical protein
LLRGDWVEAGFDNSPDPRAIRLKYGRFGAEHAGEAVPHLHREDKTQLFLTDEMTFEAFVDWLKANIVPRTARLIFVLTGGPGVGKTMESLTH